MKKTSLACLALCCALSTGCLSLFVSTKYDTVEVQTDVPDVKVQMLHNGRVLQEATAPGKIRVPKKRGLVLRLSKPGYRPRSYITMLNSTVSNLLTSCLLSIPTLTIGFWVDLQTGAVEKFSPDKIDVRMERE